MMSDRFSFRISIKLIVLEVAITCLFSGQLIKAPTTLINEEDDGVIKTITRKDYNGIEHVEYAFHAPSEGLPNDILELYCSSVKLRLYWNGYREECKQSHRKGIYLRRMARFAKHVFKEIRGVDKPFNATMLSRVDKYLAAKFDQSSDADEHFDEDDDEDYDDDEASRRKSPMENLKDKLAKKVAGIKKHHDDGAASEILEEIDSSETVKDLDKQGQHPAIAKIKEFAKKWNFKKTALLLYTRWRTMWWMTLSCLYVKYYLWDPALDEFTKLKRSLLMWPELQLVRLQDLQCKPVIFFKRIMDVCKILNPLMKIDLGQFNYNSLTRFKSDS